MLYGLLNLSFWGYFAVLMILTQITIAAITLYLHRNQSHRSIDLSPIVSHFFRFWLWLTTSIITFEWVAVHRKHHANTDREDDPHSPVILGIKNILLEGTEFYRKEAGNQETIKKYSHGTPTDWVERNIYTKYSWLGIVLMLIIDVVLFGLPGVSIWSIQMLWSPFFAAGIVNGLGHYLGYRNFELEDASKNIIPWGIFIGGEELHNNHHTYISSAKLSVKWWEFDLGWFYIKILSWFKLATIKKLPPRLESIPGKNKIDINTVKAVLGNRFQIMSSYYKKVLLPVLKEAKQHPKKSSNLVFRKARWLLRKNRKYMTSQAKSKLLILLNQTKDLKKVYQYRQSLQELWNSRASSQRELTDRLQKWCREAEASGIESLKQFSLQIRTLVLKPAIYT